MPEMLSKYFSFEHLTRTDNAGLQALNRERARAPEVLERLKKVGLMLDLIQDRTCKKIEPHSAFRCPELNGAIAGSSKKSQHMLGEAVDFSECGPDTDKTIRELFSNVIGCLEICGIPFGQLILESAKRDYGRALWIHLSLGHPYRDIKRCGQVMEMLDGQYLLLKTIRQEAK